MTIKDRLLESGAKLNIEETDFGQHRKKVEVWLKKDSVALRAFVGRLICQYPAFDMFCFGRPHKVSHGNNMASVWGSTDREIVISIDMEDCPEYGTRWRMPLKSLLAEIQEQGAKNAMAFRVTMAPEVWNGLINTASCQATPSA